MNSVETGDAQFEVRAPKRSPLGLVTGASSGIGRAIALELANLGYDLIAVGRDPARLEELARECDARNGSRCRTISLDLGTAEGARKLVADLQADLTQLDVLVNNAGFGVHGSFHTTNLERELEMGRLQFDTTLVLIKAVLPGMIARGRGRILNVASIYSFIPVPYQSVYGATKMFLLSLSEALAFELKPKGVTVSCLCPGNTTTRFRTREGLPEKLKGMTAEEVAQIGIDGMMRGKVVIVPGWHNRFLAFLTTHLPRALTMRVLGAVNRWRGVGEAH